MVVVAVMNPWVEVEGMEAVVVAWTEVVEVVVEEVEEVEVVMEVEWEQREVLETAWAVAVEVEAGDQGDVCARSEADDSWRKEVDAATAHARCRSLCLRLT